MVLYWYCFGHILSDIAQHWQQLPYLSSGCQHPSNNCVDVVVVVVFVVVVVDDDDDDDDDDVQVKK